VNSKDFHFSFPKRLIFLFHSFSRQFHSFVGHSKSIPFAPSYNSCNLLFLSCGNHLKFPPVLTSFPFLTKPFFIRVINAKTKWWDTTKLFFWHFQGARTPIFIIKHSTILCVYSLIESLKIQIPYSLKKEIEKILFDFEVFNFPLVAVFFWKHLIIWIPFFFVWKVSTTTFLFSSWRVPPAFFFLYPRSFEETFQLNK